MKILVVDDHAIFRKGLVGLLKPEPDLEIVGEAGSVREAVEQALRLRPDLILLDFSLPDGTGLDAMQPILAKLPGGKIVFLTIQDADDVLFDAIRKGAKGYILKSVPVSELLASLKALELGEPAISRHMTARIIEEFAKTDKPSGAAAELSQLSRREREILHELASGATNCEIADRMTLSENTVKHHVHNIFKKLELENRHQAIRFAQRHGL
jgi:two-component system NarL family response regulator